MSGEQRFTRHGDDAARERQDHEFQMLGRVIARPDEREKLAPYLNGGSTFLTPALRHLYKCVLEGDETLPELHKRSPHCLDMVGGAGRLNAALDKSSGWTAQYALKMASHLAEGAHDRALVQGLQGVVEDVERGKPVGEAIKPLLDEAQSRTRQTQQDAPLSARDLAALELPDVRWVLPGLVPEGLTLLAGAPKVGKSWFALSLALAKAAGRTALGAIDTTPAPTLYLALEDNRRRLKSRMKKALDGAPVPEGLDFYSVESRFPRLDEGGEAAIRRWLDDHPTAELIVIDTLQKVRPTPKGRTRSYYEIDYEVMAPIHALAGERRVGVLVLHHVRKGVSSDFVEQISGTMGLTGAADTLMVLTRTRHEGQARLRVTGRDIEEMDLSLTSDKKTAGWNLVGEYAQQELSETRKLILGLWDANPAATFGPSQAARLLDKPKGTLKRQMPQMARDGLLTKVGEKYGLAGNTTTDPNPPNPPNHSNSRTPEPPEPSRDLATPANPRTPRTPSPNRRDGSPGSGGSPGSSGSPGSQRSP